MPLIDLSQFDNGGFQRGASRWTEVLWWVCRVLFFDHRIPVPSGVKRWILRRFGATIGKNVVIRSRVNITFPWRLSVGDSVWIGDEVCILSLDRVEIGSNVCLSQRSFLCTGSHDFHKSSFDLITAPIEIGSSSWVAAGAFVGPGVTIGPGALCAAGSVIMRNVGPRTVVAGNPAGVVRTLDLS